MMAGQLLLAAALASSGTTPATDPQTAEWLMGIWTGEGMIFNQPARMRLAICPLAMKRGITLDYQLRTEPKEGQVFQFAGHGDYFPESGGRWRGRWIGSERVDHDLDGRMAANSFVVSWRNAEVETGETRYQLADDQMLEVTDRVLRRGELVPFAEARYKRTGGCPTLAESAD